MRGGGGGWEVGKLKEGTLDKMTLRERGVGYKI